MRLALCFFALLRFAPAASLYAVGDAHGDYEHLVQVLAAAKLIQPEAAATWSGGDATLVVTGDMIDKGPEPVKVIRLLKALREDAPKHGGKVILLAGNHETEFLAGTDPKKAADFIADLNRAGISVSDTVKCKGEIGEFLCGLPLSTIVGQWYFKHEGIGSTSRAALEKSVKEFGVLHIVQGHRPKAVTFDDGVERKAGEMFQHWGLLFLIDTGMSRGVGDSAGAALRISGGRATAICPDGKETLLWSEAENQAVGRAAPCKAH